MQPGSGANASRADIVSTIVLLSLVGFATIAAYSPVLFNFFAGDDFVHLTWLSDAVKNPELIWRNFHSSWLDGTTTRFYRPLISVFMVWDYLLWGGNGLGFHLTNLACHLASTVFLFLIVSSISSSIDVGGQQRSDMRWPLAASALFALYPLHPEAVSWITGRVDAVVTTFTLASFWCYILWRTRGNAIWLVATTLTMALGLLSKEMAVTLPALFVIWELAFGRASSGKTGSRLVGAAKATAFFWLVLAGYFVVRRIALGTFVGGYDDSLFFVSNWQLFLGGWVHGLRMMLVPINKELMGAHHPLTRLWEVSLICSIALTAWSLARQRRLVIPFAFLLFWLALELVPVYKIFSIGDDLEGSRLAYLATAPLCVLLTFGLAGWGKTPSGRRIHVLTGAPALALILAAGLLLWSNNQAWSRAGQEANAIRRGLDDLYRRLPGDPQVLFIGLPDNVNGAYVCRNALWGMTKHPQLARSVNNCLMVGQFEPILPFGYLKQSLLENKDSVKIFRWASESRRFLPVTIESDRRDKSSFWSGEGLKRAAAPSKKSGFNSSYSWNEDGSLEIYGGKGVRGRPVVELNFSGRACWSTDFVVVSLSNVASEGEERSGGADLLYSNDLHNTIELRRRVHCDLSASSSDSTLVFPLRGIPDWALGGTCRQMQLILPSRSHLILKSIEIVSPDRLMPRMEFANSGYLGNKGFLHLSAAERRQKIFLNATAIPGARRVELEITRPNLTFESQNSLEESRVVMKRLQCDTSGGAIDLNRDMFPAAGIYEVRPRAIGKDGSSVGVPGDHIVISVDS